ncbi:MAG: hypothetical protein ABFS45_03915 [Pseudomonadota bacterium]
MTYYTHKRLRPWRIVAMALRGLVSLLSIWPLLLIAAFFLSPVGPHLRWQYSYQLHGVHRHYIACEYIGSRGFVYDMRNGDCPLITIIDRRVIK